MASYQYAGFVKAGTDVLCIAGMDAVKAKTSALERKISRVYNTLTEMLQRESHLDAIYKSAHTKAPVRIYQDIALPSLITPRYWTIPASCIGLRGAYCQKTQLEYNRIVFLIH
jgi:hypothetical protein